MNFFRRKKKRKSTKAEILNKFQTDYTVVTFEELSSLPFNIPMDIIPNKPGAILTERIECSADSKILFKVIMSKGQQWSKHQHDCNEVIAMRRGAIQDDITKKKLIKGGFLYIPALTLHALEALEDSEFYVEFQKEL